MYTKFKGKDYYSKTPPNSKTIMENNKSMGYLQKLKQLLIKWILIFYTLVWRLKLKYGKVSEVKDKMLLPVNKSSPQIFPTFNESPGSEILNRMKSNLDNGGDYDCLIHGTFRQAAAVLPH